MRTKVTIAEERDWSENKGSTLSGVICEDELWGEGPVDRGLWIAQGIANVMGRHVFCLSIIIEAVGGFILDGRKSVQPVFPIDDGECAYHNVEGQEDYPTEPFQDYIRRMQSEGRWQGDPNHSAYPW